MAARSQADSKRKYSWWWDSHISPKNSKWLQENLTDMDSKVKQMIKLIEEDADSFARRAEMYYKKRPELMKLVEEFYRAYRALAERYDHATGALRQAQRTMAEAFPNQAPFILGDDSPAGSATDCDPRTPDMPPIRAPFDPDELQKDALGISPSHAINRNGAFTEKSDPGRKGLKQFNDLFGLVDGMDNAKFAEGRVRKGLNFHDPEEKGRGVQNNGIHDLKARAPSESEQVSKAELEILNLKNALAKLEAEKEAGLLQYEQSLERLSKLESEVSRATEDSRGLNERASKAEAEVQTLKEVLAQLEAEKESSFLQYQGCLEKISIMENNLSLVQKDAGELNERASKAETEARSLKQDMCGLEAEKIDSQVQYSQCLEKISDLEDKLHNAQEDAKRFSERADDAEREIEASKHALTKLTEEKEAAFTQYQQCLVTIVSLEHKIACFEEEARRLNLVIDDGTVKLKSSEERCLLLEKSNQTIHSELESVMQKVAAQSDELTEKQKELGRLWACVQEEHLRFMEAETAFQTLQHLHSQSQEELRSVVAQLQNRAQILEDLEARNQSLKDEVEHVRVENKSLSEVNFSSALTIQNLQDEISSLRETIKKLEAEVELRVDQRNALQQEIYCLKEELNELNQKHQAIMRQVESVGFSPESFGSSVKDLKDVNIMLKEVCERDRTEKVSLLEKLENMEKLIDKNAHLENSLSDLNQKHQAIMRQVESVGFSPESFGSSVKDLKDVNIMLKEVCERDRTEKVSLLEKLENMEKLIDKNAHLENSLSDLNQKHQAIMRQVESVGFSPESLGSSVKELKDVNIMLKEVCERDRTEKVSLLEKLENMEKLIDKNALLENSLSDLNVELEGVGEKLKALEESCQYLVEEKSILVSEKDLMASELQFATDNLEKLTEKNHILENFLLDANAELEGLREKSKSLEDFCLLLVNEKSELASMKGSLSSQLDFSEKSLQDLEKNYTELEEKYSLLEKERQSSLHEVQELQVRLDAEKQEHANLAQLSESQLAGMASQICLLQEESLCRKKEYEKELDKAVNAEIEIFILQKCAQELEEKNSSLLLDHQKLMEASKLSEKLISDMRHENCEQQEEVECLSDKIKTLRMGLYQVLMTLELDANQCENKSKQDQKLLNNVLNRLQESQEFLFKTQDENQRLFTENSVLVTLLGKLQLEVENLVKTQDEELTTRSEQFLVLQNESQELSGINEEMKLKLIEGDRKEEALKVELNNLHVQLSDLQGAFQNLQEENCKVHDDQRSLMKSFSDLQMEKCELEEENFCILVETVSQSTLSLIFRDIICEKSVEIKKLGESLDKLCHDNIGLNEKVKMLEKELDKFSGLEDEKRELHKMVEDLKCKYDEVEVIRSDQEMQIIKLSGDYDQKTKEAENIREVNQKLEFEIRKLHEEFQEVKDRKENLSHELVEERNEVELQESQAVALFAELQISAVREALFEGKLRELLKICESLEDGNCSKDMEIDQLKERVSTLEGGNAELKALVAAYLPAFMSLRDCVTSLEKHALPDATLHEGDSKESKDAAVVVHAKGFHQMSEGQSGMVPGGTLDFQDLQMRIRAIEKEIIEKERLVMLENLSYHSKLDAAIRQIEELKSGSSARQKGVETRRYVKPKPEDGELGATPSDDLRRQKRTHEISEDGNEVMTKDIILDQISDCSSHGISRRETKQADEHMLEIWETADRDDSIDLTVGKTQKVTASQKKKKHIRQRPSAESTVEKEVGVDKLEISKRLSGSRQEGNERKILERLDSDAQKLTNLQITVQDLMSKVEITEKSEKGKGIEYDNVKEQLEESEEAIMKLFEVNRKLMKTVEDEPQYFEEKPELAPDESGNVRRRKISEQARRVSEKIGRLQLEVQKLQFVLLKLDDENRSRGKTKITEGKTKVLLQDYLYGSTRTRQKRKKAHFCSCVQPPTKGD